MFPDLLDLVVPLGIGQFMFPVIVRFRQRNDIYLELFELFQGNCIIEVCSFGFDSVGVL